jgi:dihydrofolate synthase/folylpolyglutamate synthase
VIEAGIGGLLDSTNIITPVLSVITSISKDHAYLLGETLEEIAFQKAGIIKPGVPAVIGPKADFPIMHEKADELYVVEKTPGFYDLENAAIARKALEVLGVPEHAIEEGLKYRPRCRFEIHGNIIFDVAHNPDGFKRLLEGMEIHFPGQPFAAAVGMSKDKEIEKCLTLLAEKAQYIYLLQASLPRAATIEEMASILDRIGYKDFSRELILPDKDLLVVCGTFFVMEEAHRRLLGSKEGVK